MTSSADKFASAKVDRRKVMLGLLFCSAAGVAALRQPSKKLDFLGKHKLEDVIPKRIGDWTFVAASGLVVPPEDQLSQALYSQLLTRVYSNGKGSSIMLLMAGSGNQTGFLQIHRPETCYTAGGYQISSIAPHQVRVGSKSIPTNLMDATAGEGTTEHVIYWTRVGDRMPLSWSQQRLAVAEMNLRGLIPDAILVRISIVGDGDREAQTVIDDFLRTMFAAIPSRLHSILIA